jgi:hypothetical protein
MSHIDYFLARALMEDRMREANQHHLAREVRRREQPSSAATPVPKVRRRSRVWGLVHLRQAHS